MSIIPKVKGTQDFLDCSLFNFIIDQFTKQVSRYNYTQIATPILESVELFKRSLGQHTDVVSKEMFLIDAPDDQERICLRPEATAATVRAFVEAKPVTPWKVFTYGPMFRYERPQKGRYRQFHQINLEVIGSASISQDAEVITMLDRFFHETLSFNAYALQINFLGTLAERAEYLKKLRSFLRASQSALCKTCIERIDKNTLRVFDCKNEECQKLYRTAPHITDHLSPESAQEWAQLQEELSLLSVSFVHNPKLVRGLDYYNKTVFEFTSDNLGAQNAFCGGGRYDQLVKELGSREDYPAIGAAIGLERLMMLLEPRKDQLSLGQQKPLYVVIPLEDEQQPLALLVADMLHAANLTADTLFDDSLKSRMRKANKMGASCALIIGENEQKNRSVLVKNMMNSEQQEVAQIDLIAYLQG